jgi:hypothetical protein
VLNLEGAGSSGPAYLVRTAPQSGHLIDAFRAVAPAPLAQSFVEEVFKRMPNDTDFSVALRAGVQGIDFAFAGERNHYHTPLDTVANLDLGSLQHHGENVLPLLKVLVESDLEATRPSYVYANLGKRLWLHWEPGLGAFLALAAVLGLGLATWRIRPQPWRLLAVAAAAIAVATVSMLATYGALLVVDRLVGTRPAWPADPWPWRAVIFATPVLVLALAGPWLARRFGGATVYLGVWWIATALAVAIAVWLPLAAYLFVPAAILAAALSLIGSVRPGQHGFAAIGAIAALPPAWFLLGTAASMESTQGFTLAIAMAAPLALLAMLALPAAPRDPSRAVTLCAAGALLLGGAMAALAAPYSAWRPQHLNLTWIEEAGAATATVAASSPNPLPARLRDAATLERRSVFPWDSEEQADAADVTALGAPAPSLASIEAADDGFVRLQITPASGALATVLWVPVARIEDSVRVEGRTTTSTPRPDGVASYRRLYFVAPPAAFVVEVKLRPGAPETAYLVDVHAGLPAAAAALGAARGELAVPFHSGDRTLVYRKVTL